jgi:hypothetical protein
MSSTLFQGFNSTTGTLPALDTSTFSIEVWLNPTNYNSNNQYNNMISFRETYATKGFRFGLSTTSGLNTDTAGAPIFWTNQSGGNFSTSTSSYPILINNWYQILVTYDGTNCKIYVNGSLYSNTTGTYLPPSGNGLEIGGDGDGLFSFTGQLSNYKHYNRALSAQEVLNNFNGLRNRFGI